MTRTAFAALLSAGLFTAGSLLPEPGHAGPLNLAAVSCAKYENEVLQSTVPGYTADPIDTVMWLFGFSIARSGERAMYGDSLTAFGFALDAECKNNPTASLLEAVTTVKSKRQNPMDLSALDCSTYEARHVGLRKTDPQGANTLTMWLFGYSVGLGDAHVLDADSLAKFDTGLDAYCTQYPGDSLFDALSPRQPVKPKHAAPKPAVRNPSKNAARSARAARPAVSSDDYLMALGNLTTLSDPTANTWSPASRSTT